MKNKRGSNLTADWRWAAAGAFSVYSASLLLILNAMPFISGGLAATAIYSFIKVVKRKADTKELHKFVPKPVKADPIKPGKAE